jgi:DNA-binding IclR family transcriptional regulator
MRTIDSRSSKRSPAIAAPSGGGGPDIGTPGKGLVKSADRVMGILDLLADRQALRFTDITRELALPPSSAHALLQTMVHRGFLETGADGYTYRLGIHAWRIGQAYRGSVDLVHLAHEAMSELRDITGETVQLSTLDGVHNIYLSIVESRSAMKLTSVEGGRLPAHATGLGKMLLASLPLPEAKSRLQGAELIKFTEQTITDLDDLLEELFRIRERGYSIDNEEQLVGCRCVAMPVHDGDAHVVAAISVAAPTPRCGPSWVEDTLDPLRKTVAAVSLLVSIVPSQNSV